jgi:hypothetical protein
LGEHILAEIVFRVTQHLSLRDQLEARGQNGAHDFGPGSGLMVQRCGFFVAPIREHLQEMGLIIPTLDWSWAARFGYQIVVKRGAGGSFFRSLYADFLEESSEFVPEISAAGLPGRMTEISARWRDLAAVLKEQSERETCSPELFRRACELTSQLADAEESFFTSALAISG